VRVVPVQNSPLSPFFEKVQDLSNPPDNMKLEIARQEVTE
jgi:hypothetical protein